MGTASQYLSLLAAPQVRPAVQQDRARPRSTPHICRRDILRSRYLRDSISRQAASGHDSYVPCVAMAQHSHEHLWPLQPLYLRTVTPSSVQNQQQLPKVTIMQTALMLINSRLLTTSGSRDQWGIAAVHCCAGHMSASGTRRACPAAHIITKMLFGYMFSAYVYANELISLNVLQQTSNLVDATFFHAGGMKLASSGVL